MDREILFRGKRLDNKKWVYGYLICCAGRQFIVDQSNPTALRSFTTHHCDRYDWRSVEITPSTVGQYTGLTDKNGEKIFEGGVMEFTAYGLGYKGEVTFIDGNFSVLCKKASPFLDDVIKRGGTVIGNIHDNPELIGGDGDG